MRRGTIFGLAALLALAACSDDSPYVAVSGGGIMFNYRIAEASATIERISRPVR